MAQATKAELAAAQRLYEVDGLSLQKIADHFGKNVNTVSNWKKKGDWAERGSAGVVDVPVSANSGDLPAPQVQADNVTVTDSDDGWPDDDEPIVFDLPDYDKDERIAQLEAELAEALAEANKHRPTADVSSWKWNDVDDVLAHFGAKFDEIVAQDLRRLNVQRTAQGLARVDATPEKIRERAQEFVTRQKRTPKGNVRVIKMVRPYDEIKNPNNPKGTLVQIPMEGQINNLNGSQYDAIARYKDKGFKVASPMYCARKDCWEYAAVAADGTFEFLGYCGRVDMRAIEKIDDPSQFRQPENLITAASGLGRQ